MFIFYGLFHIVFDAMSQITTTTRESIKAIIRVIQFTVEYLVLLFCMPSSTQSRLELTMVEEACQDDAASLASACLMLGPDGVHLLDASGDPAMAMLRPPIASAALSDEQRLVAETWRTVDRLFVDRTFNNHGDW